MVSLWHQKDTNESTVHNKRRYVIRPSVPVDLPNDGMVIVKGMTKTPTPKLIEVLIKACNDRKGHRPILDKYKIGEQTLRRWREDYPEMRSAMDEYNRWRMRQRRTATPFVPVSV